MTFVKIMARDSTPNGELRAYAVNAEQIAHISREVPSLYTVLLVNNYRLYITPAELDKLFAVIGYYEI